SEVLSFGALDARFARKRRSYFRPSLDLNGDGECDTYIIEPMPDPEDSSKITIKIGGTDRVVEGVFNLGNGGLFPGYFPTDFSLLLDFYTDNSNITKYDFRWHQEFNDWVLYKASNWVEPYRERDLNNATNHHPSKNIFPTNFEVRRVECCVKFSDFNSPEVTIEYVEYGTQAQQIGLDFDKIKRALPEGENGSLFKAINVQGQYISRNIPIDLIHELSLILNTANAGSINDFAYYLYKSNQSTLAIMLLEKILIQFPDRMVAILNLADSYWALGIKKDACPLYAKYQRKMIINKRRDRIPAYVEQRIACP
ncbi:hypothetical protein QN408_25105, partial [Pseudomonas sp. CCI4.2]|nr:hypothetical protein [Pseudomonas sp. CCI4.2]